MEEHPEISKRTRDSLLPPIARDRWVVDLIILLVIAALAFVYGYQRAKVGHLADQGAAASAAIDELQRQLNETTEKLNNLATERQAAAQAGAHTPARRTTERVVVDKHYAQLQAQLADQQRQLRETQDLIAKNHEELEGSLNSTRDDLNGSIAKTHDELVALAKRGERSYFEFDLAKSKQFQRFGPLPLSLRKTDTKHNTFDMAMIVDDNQLMKKKVNLYEPIWIHTENESQPVQIVVNRITKEVVHGYVSVPKYRMPELATTGVSSSNTVASPRNSEGETSKPE